MKITHGVVSIRTVLLFIVVFPLSVFAADNVMINAEIKGITLQKNPTIGMSFTPGIEPGVVISQPEGQSDVIPGYRVRFKGIAFILGISCDANLLDDCSTYQYSEDYSSRLVYTRYLQTSDSQFKTPEGITLGDRWGKVIQTVGSDTIIYSGNDSCVLLQSGWHACIDLMSTNRVFDMKARRLLPKKTAPIDFFYKDK